MTAIGKIKSLSKSIFVEAPNGRRWRLYQHNQIFAGDRIFSTANEKVEIILNNNSLVIIEDGQSWTPTDETFPMADEYFVADATLSESAKGKTSTIEQLLQQLLVTEVTGRRMRPYSSIDDLADAELHFSERRIS
ncbi:MAG: hypothetical protein OFPII_31930 [Osedax symbiont Rs1]|nr:MAG: hypothetical protein OFPII_31930 [Osedax symbiont Rs1]